MFDTLNHLDSDCRCCETTYNTMNDTNLDPYYNLYDSLYKADVGEDTSSNAATLVAENQICIHNFKLESNTPHVECASKTL